MEQSRKNTNTTRVASDHPHCVSSHKRKRRRRRNPNPLVLILTALLIAVSFWKMTSELVDKIQSRKLVAQMADQALVELTQPTETQPAETQSTTPHQPEEPASAEPMEFAPISVDFNELLHHYPDLVAWLYCPTTSLNYPVMQTDNNQFYVDHRPDGKESAGGSLFLDCTNAGDFSDANTVIYGHDMKDGTMFGYLHNYDNREYYKKHSDIYLLTPEWNYRLEILAAAVVPDDSWLYAKRMDARQRKDWAMDVYLLSMIGTQDTADLEAEHYVTLSTCSYEYENARFVLVASLKKLAPDQ